MSVKGKNRGKGSKDNFVTDKPLSFFAPLALAIAMVPSAIIRSGRDMHPCFAGVESAEYYKHLLQFNCKLRAVVRLFSTSSVVTDVSQLKPSAGAFGREQKPVPPILTPP